MSLTPESKEPKEAAKIEFDRKISSQVTFHENLNQDVIYITADKVRLILKRHLEKIEKKKAWVVPLSIFIPLMLIPITTENFRNAFSLPASFWQSSVYLGIIVSFIWLVVTGIKSLRNPRISEESIVDAMKKEG